MGFRKVLSIIIFHTKSELLIAIYKTIYKKLEKERNDLLLGQDPSNIEIFIKQLRIANDYE